MSSNRNHPCLRKTSLFSRAIIPFFIHLPRMSAFITSLNPQTGNMEMVLYPFSTYLGKSRADETNLKPNNQHLNGKFKISFLIIRSFLGHNLAKTASDETALIETTVKITYQVKWWDTIHIKVITIDLTQVFPDIFTSG